VEFAAERFETRLAVVRGIRSAGRSRPRSMSCANRRAMSRLISGPLSTASGRDRAIASDTVARDPDALVEEATRANIRASVDHLRTWVRVVERRIERDGLVIVERVLRREGTVEFLDGNAAAGKKR